jgi:hypothetical protein
LLAKAEIQRLGRVSVPHSTDYSMVDVYGLLSDQAKLLSGEKFIFAIGLRKLNVN